MAVRMFLWNRNYRSKCLRYRLQQKLNNRQVWIDVLHSVPLKGMLWGKFLIGVIFHLPSSAKHLLNFSTPPLVQMVSVRKLQSSTITVEVSCSPCHIMASEVNCSPCHIMASAFITEYHYFLILLTFKKKFLQKKQNLNYPCNYFHSTEQEN